MKLERMQFIADHFQELHLEKIDRLELIDRLMWQEYEKETQPYRRVKILETLLMLRPTYQVTMKQVRLLWKLVPSLMVMITVRKMSTVLCRSKNSARRTPNQGLATIPIIPKKRTANITGDCTRNTRRMLRIGKLKTSIQILMRSGVLLNYRKPIVDIRNPKAIGTDTSH